MKILSRPNNKLESVIAQIFPHQDSFEASDTRDGCCTIIIQQSRPRAKKILLAASIVYIVLCTSVVGLVLLNNLAIFFFALPELHRELASGSMA